MSGHNKWSKIKHKKAATDSKRSKEFSMLAKLITVESKSVEGNIDSPGLRKAIDRAKAANMPTANIDRAVKKGGGKDSALLIEVTYEAYGPGGSALIIEALTDNKNRMSAEIKHTLSKNGLELAGQGAVLWAFEKKDGVWSAKTTIPLSPLDSEKLERLTGELEENEDVQVVYTNRQWVK